MPLRRRQRRMTAGASADSHRTERRPCHLGHGPRELLEHPRKRCPLAAPVVCRRTMTNSVTSSVLHLAGRVHGPYNCGKSGRGVSMVHAKKPRAGKRATAPVVLRPEDQSEVVKKYVARLRAEYGEYVIPVEEMQARVAAEMGSKSLTDVLFEMREEKPY